MFIVDTIYKWSDFQILENRKHDHAVLFYNKEKVKEWRGQYALNRAMLFVENYLIREVER